MTLKRRIAALETSHVGAGRFIVAIGPSSIDVVSQARDRGIEIAVADTVVVVRKPSACPVSIRLDGQPR